MGVSRRVRNVADQVIVVDVMLAGAALVALALYFAFGWWWVVPVVGAIVVLYVLDEIRRVFTK